ncbi:MAG TPA: helix-turn-helix domain-containing protein, partial [Acidobacteriota bacterium]|nr:helix-turn-helix domain-containing protein [Acidobacteriota bacterium]
YQGLLREAKKKMVADALQQSGGNVGEAAELLGMHPNNLRRVLRNLGLRESLESDSLPSRRYAGTRLSNPCDCRLQSG